MLRIPVATAQMDDMTDTFTRQIREHLATIEAVSSGLHEPAANHELLHRATLAAQQAFMAVRSFIAETGPVIAAD